jgi:hypothetical protein
MYKCIKLSETKIEEEAENNFIKPKQKPNLETPLQRNNGSVHVLQYPSASPSFALGIVGIRQHMSFQNNLTTSFSYSFQLFAACFCVAPLPRSFRYR